MSKLEDAILPICITREGRDKESIGALISLPLFLRSKEEGRLWLIHPLSYQPVLYRGDLTLLRLEQMSGWFSAVISEDASPTPYFWDYEEIGESERKNSLLIKRFRKIISLLEKEDRNPATDLLEEIKREIKQLEKEEESKEGKLILSEDLLILLLRFSVGNKITLDKLINGTLNRLT